MEPYIRNSKKYLHEVFHRPSAHLAPIDGIRALSMLGVLLYHCFLLVKFYIPEIQFKLFVVQTPWHLEWIWNLDYTVDAFFVISGYLIATMLFREHSLNGSIQRKFTAAQNKS